jgi:phospholipid-binding lipoprotein MlaA
MTAAWRQTSTWRWGRARAAFAALALALATNAQAAAAPPDDPFEPLNRAVLDFNLAVFDWALAPAASLYRSATTEPVRRSVGNFLQNLRAPMVLANDVLQGETERADTTLRRFAINSTIGMLGLFDPATDYGYAAHHEDLGQTLAVHGVPAGPYLMLPLLGPCNVRDAMGRVGDYLMLNLYLVDTDAVLGATALQDTESRMDDLRAMRADSLDLYARLRSMHEQRRVAEIANGAPGGDVDYDAIFADDP